jgi:hypothetical protein
MKVSGMAAAVVTGVIIITCFGLVIYVIERPVYTQDVDKKYGVIAIRDHVHSFQKSGTRLFSLPYLNKKYEEVVYFTQGYRDEHRARFVYNLDRLLHTHDSVDVFLLAHSNQYYTWIEEIDGELRKKIRLVYNTGCSGSLQAPAWERMGVRNYVSHQSPLSISPVFYFYFLRRYGNGYPLEKAIEESNAAMHRVLHHFKTLTFGFASLNEIMEKESEGERTVHQ